MREKLVRKIKSKLKDNGFEFTDYVAFLNKRLHREAKVGDAQMFSNRLNQMKSKEYVLGLKELVVLEEFLNCKLIDDAVEIIHAELFV